MKADEYQCAMCGGVFTKGWSEQEARAETQQYWPNTSQEDLAVVCDDCWQKVHPETHPVEYDASLFPFRSLGEPDAAWMEFMAEMRQAIAGVFGIPPSLVGNSGVVVDGTVQPVPLRLEQEAVKHD